MDCLAEKESRELAGGEAPGTVLLTEKACLRNAL